MEILEKNKKPYFILAPMVGNSELAWRTLARRYGANICYTEMVHCEAFLRSKRNPVKNNWYCTNKEDRPLVIQICGNKPDVMLEACKILQTECDAIDINFGCPQEIARKGKYGSWLQDDWELVRSIVSTLSSNLDVPLFCKIRVFESIEKTVEYAKMIESAGCKLIAVHGRTREQKGVNSGLASWEHIKKVKENLSIPVVANGNILYFCDLQACLDYTGCDGVMVAETHLYNPLIFCEIEKSSIEVYKEYLDICRNVPNSFEYKNIKSHSFKILNTLLKNNSTLMVSLNKCNTLEEFYNFIAEVEQMDLDKNNFKMLPYIRDRKHNNKEDLK
ncbi:tRNA-dihydrouridine(16/17) synthase [NAD(P)(+)]-like [Nosema granulosis]|uniref:tRNA-dihydrouridine synthase n=1 Tax=Nosema granulosis TaxID=83296 RepID=A0A9P6KZS1_9MICR|nr:tRNA-dihydrouridine(16/17) synthase [NAD(P)(+)]-like [Nosema granulosis]